MADAQIRGDGRSAGSFAEMLDRVVWDYTSRDAEVSPLLSTARFFDDFPWDGCAEPPTAGGDPAGDS